MKKIFFKITIALCLMSSGAFAKTVSQHEALQYLNKVTGGLVKDQEVQSDKLDKALSKIDFLEKEIASLKSNQNTSKKNTQDKSEIEIDKKILEYVNGKK